MLSCFFNKLDRELRENSHKKDITIYMGIPLVISMIIILIFINSSFIFFYHNYFIYSLIFGTILLIIQYIFKNYFRVLSSIGTSILLIVISFFVIPYIYHFTTARDNCFKATIKSKKFRHSSSGSYGSVTISNIVSNIKELKSIDFLSKISYNDYSQLPKIGENIMICGKISKVGYQYNNIE